MQESPNYYAIIPASVRYDKDITPNAKLLYGEITALCNKEGKCWASNLYFANLYGVSKVSISKWINQLVKNGYLSSEVIYQEGSKEILNRYLRIVNDPIKEKFKDNNTTNNTTNKKHIYGEFKKVRLSDEEYSKLDSDFGNTKELIKFLDEYKEMNGKVYKNDYLAIRKWVVDAVKRQNKNIENSTNEKELRGSAAIDSLMKKYEMT